jgi:hypothetical protein
MKHFLLVIGHSVTNYAMNGRTHHKPLASNGRQMLANSSLVEIYNNRFRLWSEIHLPGAQTQGATFAAIENLLAERTIYQGTEEDIVQSESGTTKQDQKSMLKKRREKNVGSFKITKLSTTATP